MKTLEQAARKALEALDGLYLPGELERVNAAITALRGALEQPVQQEPVAFAMLEMELSNEELK